MHEKQSSSYSGFGRFNFVYINIATKFNIVNSIFIFGTGQTGGGRDERDY
jgi:hypothetical protein